jgi:DNA-binding HxlR family transcriptional regulator
MTFIAEPGIMLDVLGYNMLFFSQNIFEYRERALFANEEDPLLYFNLFRTGRRKIEPPNRFFPLFRFNSKYLETYPLFSYFWERYDFAANNSADFLKSLRGEDFRRFCVEFYLKEHSDSADIDGIMRGDLRNAVQAMAILKTQGRDIQYFVDFLSGFDDMIDELIPYLADCHARMAAFHERIVPKLKESICGVFESSESVLRRMSDIGEGTPLREQNYTIHLMEHLTLLSKRFSERRYLLFMCANSERAILHWGDTSSISLMSFGQDFGNDVKYSIIQELRKGEKTASQLAKALYISRSTTDRCLKSLQSNLAVTVSRKIGTEVFFVLNPKYFLTVKAKLLRDINNILDDICYGGSVI